MAAIGMRKVIPGQDKKEPSLLSGLLGVVLGRKNFDVSRVDIKSYGTFEGAVKDGLVMWISPRPRYNVEQTSSQKPEYRA